HDATQSLAAVSSIQSLCDELKRLGDADVDASLVHVASVAPQDFHVAETLPPGASALSAGASTSQLQRFRVLRPHAKGGLGEVFVAQDLELRREVALKEIQLRY